LKYRATGELHESYTILNLMLTVTRSSGQCIEMRLTEIPKSRVPSQADQAQHDLNRFDVRGQVDGSIEDALALVKLPKLDVIQG
jgi:hypothetical protein